MTLVSSNLLSVPEEAEEVEVFKAVMRWLDHDEKKRMQSLPEVELNHFSNLMY